MTKKIVARLSSNDFSYIFHEDNPDFENMESSFHIPIINTENSFEFNPDRRLEDWEWFYVIPDETQKITMINPYIDTLENTESTNTITADEYQNIRWIGLIEKEWENQKILLTRIFPRYYTLAKKILKWSDWPKLVEESKSVDFTWVTHAFWNGTKLYFNSYDTIRPLFHWLEDFYRVATEEEKVAFLDKDYFECSDKTIDIWTRNLRRIASIITKIDWSNQSVRDKYIEYAKKYPKVKVSITTDGKMKIDSNQDITGIINILEERIYTTPITGEEREANAITKLA